MGMLGIFNGIYGALLIPIACDIAGSSRLDNQAIGFYNLAICVPVRFGSVRFNL